MNRRDSDLRSRSEGRGLYAEGKGRPWGGRAAGREQLVFEMFKGRPHLNVRSMTLVQTTVGKPLAND